MGMGAAPAKGKSPSPVMNITPLVDVALVILIIFMVIAPMLSKTFSLNIPPESKDKTSEPTSDEPLVLTIDAGGVMRLNRQVVTDADLPTMIPGMLAAAKHKVLHFDADDKLPYGTVVSAVDKCREAGAGSIAIVTKKLPEP